MRVSVLVSLLGTVILTLNSATVSAQGANTTLPTTSSMPGAASLRKPVKLEVTPIEARSLLLGADAEILIAVLDTDNRRAPAPKDLAVRIEMTLPSGKRETREVIIRRGERSTKIRVPIDEPGIVQIRARQPELLEGGTYLNVRAPRRSGLLHLRPTVHSGQFGFSRSPVISLVQTHVPTDRVELDLRYTPHRPLLADGKDTATIYAFLTGDVPGAPVPIRVTLFNNVGRLQPMPLIIPEGADSGTAQLTSSDIGTALVEHVRSVPPIRSRAFQPLSIQFAPPVVGLRVQVSPPLISLADSADLIVRLVDGADNPLATDVARSVSFAIENGRGEILAKDVTITAGGFEGRTTFQPTWLGSVTVRSSTPNLPGATATVDVGLPMGLALASGLGGLLGGLIAYLTAAKDATRWRIFVGLVTGVVLYWAFMVGVVSLVTRGVALNPISALVASILGGWAGTPVLGSVLEKVGIRT
jgi:hypothetical protein